MAHAAETSRIPTSLEAELATSLEQRKSFDALASVRMFRYDLEHFEQILPETRERVQDEELSLIAEGLGRAAHTTFVLKREAGDLHYFNQGQWSSYTGMLLVGEQVAKREAAADPRKQFLAEDAVNDLYHLYQMRALQPGQQHVWSSPYRYDIETQYGREFMTSCGRFPDRKMGFLYRASCDEQGNVVLESQTVDRSDEAAFGAVDTYAAQHPSARMGELVAQYDGVLVGKHGGEFYAGRRGAEVNENVWQTMLEHRDLVEYFLDKLEALAWGSLEGSDLEEAAKRHVYGVWAAFKRRIDGIGTAAQSSEYRPKQQGVSILGMVRLEQEVHQAFRQFAAQGQVMAGCGGAIAMRAGLDIMNASGAEVFNTIFGETEDKFGSLSFTCPKGHYNTRPFGRLIDNCRTCRASVRC